MKPLSCGSTAPSSSKSMKSGALIQRPILSVDARILEQRSTQFRDDRLHNRLRTGSRPANLSIVNHFIVNLIKHIPNNASLKTRRETLGWDDQYLRYALIQKWG